MESIEQQADAGRDAYTAGRDLFIQMPVPEQARRRRDLPRDVPDFTGRRAELTRLLASLDQTDAPITSVVISAIDGMAGVGKTTLAVHAAHRLTARFCDGQLFLDLHGFAPDRQPLEPADALDALLRAMGVTASDIPPSADERAALYRTTLAGKRMLLVLDNAASEAQVRPLVPGSAGCAVLVTSRRYLSGLEGAVSLSLDILEPRDAIDLFGRIVGADRIAGEAAAVVDVVKLCGLLPLAIRIAGARLASRPRWSVADLNRRLRDQHRRLAELAVGNSSVAAAFEMSYRQLDTAARRMFRLLGLHRGWDIDAYAAAAIAGIDLDEAERLLDDLLDMHLLEQRLTGRYRFHDLLRHHAQTVASLEESAERQREAITRLLDYYLHMTSSSADILDPDRRRAEPSPGPPPTCCPRLQGYPQALSWLEAERLNLVAAVRLAADSSLHTHAWQLTHALYRYFFLRGYTRGWLDTHKRAISAARADGNPRAEADIQTHLGVAYRRLGRYSEAVKLQEQALARYREAGDTAGEMEALTDLGIAFRRLGRYREAVEYQWQAVQLHEKLGDSHGEGHILTNLGIVYERLGNYQRALDCHRRALALARQTGDHSSESLTLTNMGIVFGRMGRYDAAIDRHRKALEMAEASGDRHVEGHTLNNLAVAYERTGRLELALDHHDRALVLLRRTGSRGDECEALIDYARTLGVAGRNAAASKYCEQALAVARQIGDPYLEGRALDGLAWAIYRTEPDRARRRWQEALPIFAKLETPEASAVQRQLEDVETGGESENA